MNDQELYWTKVAALGQVFGAIATFLAVFMSLWLAYHARKPRLRVTVTYQIIIGGMADGLDFLAIDVANTGERPVHIRSVGWRTGWPTKWPSFLARGAAYQMTPGAEMFGLGTQPPFELQPGASASMYCDMDRMTSHADGRPEPIFTRNWPLIGKKRTRLRACVYTADGHSFYAKPAKALADALVAAEKGAADAPETG